MLLLLGGVLAFSESIIGVGAFLPGEVMITGVAGSIDVPLLPLLVVCVVIGACLGDQMGYWTGHHLGPRMSRSRAVQRLGTERWDTATDLISRHGATAVLISRMLPLVRTVMPAVAGVARMSAARFTMASLAGSTIWALAWISAGPVIARLVQDPRSIAATVVMGGAILGVLHWRRTRAG